MVVEEVTPIFTPDNEPYLGQQMVHMFDLTIISAMEKNTVAANWTQENKPELSSLQYAACQIIPQGFSISLSIRELIRQGYLFSAKVLLRPLLERTMTIHYIINHEDGLSEWEKGWRYYKRPNLKTMLIAFRNDYENDPLIEHGEIDKYIRSVNSIIHGDPFCSDNNIVIGNEGKIGYASSKIFNNPNMANAIAHDAMCWTIVLVAAIPLVFGSMDRNNSEGCV